MARLSVQSITGVCRHRSSETSRPCLSHYNRTLPVGIEKMFRKQIEGLWIYGKSSVKETDKHKDEGVVDFLTVAKYTKIQVYYTVPDNMRRLDSRAPPAVRMAVILVLSVREEFILPVSRLIKNMEKSHAECL